MAAASKAVERLRDCHEGSIPSPSAGLNVPLAERQRCQASNLARRVRFPQGTLERKPFRGRRCWYAMPGFEPGGRRFDSYPRNLGRTLGGECVSQEQPIAGSSNGRIGRSERLDVGSTPAPAALSEKEVIRLNEEPVLNTGVPIASGLWV